MERRSVPTERRARPHALLVILVAVFIVVACSACTNGLRSATATTSLLSGATTSAPTTTPSSPAQLDTAFPVMDADGDSLSVALTAFDLSASNWPGFQDAEITFQITNTGTTILTNFCPYAVFVIDATSDQEIQIPGTVSGGSWCASNLLPASYIDVTDGDNRLSPNDSFTQVILVPTSSTAAPFPTWTVSVPG